MRNIDNRERVVRPDQKTGAFVGAPQRRFHAEHRHRAAISGGVYFYSIFNILHFIGHAGGAKDRV